MTPLRLADSWRPTNAALFIALVLVEGAAFFTQVALNVAPYYPPDDDQTVYLFNSYDIVSTIHSQGIGAVLARFLQPYAPNGAIFPLQGALTSMLLGMTRPGVLAVNLIVFVLLQAVTFSFVRYATGRDRDAWLAVAMLLVMQSTFFWAGGIFDYRIDFFALCQFGIWTMLVLRSRLFRSRRWSVIAGAAGGWMGLTRYISIVYMAPIMGMVFVVYVIAWLRARDSACRISRWRSLLNTVVSGLIIIVIVGPLFWINRRLFYDYYFVSMFVSEEKEIRAKEFGLFSISDHLLFYPRSLLFDHLGTPWMVLCAGLALWFALGTIMYRQQPAKQIWSALRLEAPNVAFLALVVAVPLAILNTSVHKSPVVGGILCVPVILAVLTLILALRGESAGGAEPRLDRPVANKIARRVGTWYAAIDARLVFAVVFGAAIVFLYSVKPWLVATRYDQIKVNSMYDKIIDYIIEADLPNPTVSLDRIADYMPSNLMLMIQIYEHYGRMVKITGKFGHEMFAVPHREALAMFEDSDIIVLTDATHGREAPYPLNTKIREYWSEVHDWTVEHRVLLYSVEIFGIPHQVFVRPTVKIVGVSGDWITSAGITIDADRAFLVKRPFLVLEGAVNYQWLGGVPEPRVTGVGNNGETLVLPATLKAGDSTYEIVVDAAALASAEGGQVEMNLTFDRFFVPDRLGINNDARELVVRGPAKHELRASQPN